MKTRNRRISSPVIAVILLLAGGTLTGHAQNAAEPYSQALLDVARLPRFRPVASVGNFSSYDRSGGNDKGFSGRYSFLRKEGDGLVIAEMTGPGAITRIWTATPIDDPIEFYFDGEAAPRLSLPFSKLFSGDTPPFVGALSGHGVGGYYSYVPLEYAKSVKIVVRTKLFHFYQVNYVTYEPSVPVRTYAPGDAFQAPSVTDPGAAVSGQHLLAPGKAVTILESDKPGRIESLKIGPAEAFSGGARDIVLRIYWDGAKRPAVNVPVGDFFGYSFGQPAIHSMLLGTEDGWDYVRFPMPFGKSARVELVSERGGGAPLQVQSEVVVSGRGKGPDEGTFHAEWHRENPTPDGQPFTYLDVSGRGQVVGVILQSQGREPGHTFFFEGIDLATVDGEVAIHGTGTEDMFNGGWYEIPGRWNGAQSLPFSGCLEYNHDIARTGGYRLLIGDAYSFHHSLRYTVDHGGRDNKTAADYASTAYYYLDNAEGKPDPLPDAASRAVLEPESFLLTFFPSAPPTASLLNASLEAKAINIDGKPVTFASFVRVNVSELKSPLFDSLVPPGNDFSGGLFGPPDLVLAVDVHAAGDYALFIDGLVGPAGALLQARVNDRPVGDVLDFYSPDVRRSGPRKLAELHLSQGRNLIYLALPGRNPKSVGEGVDLIEIKGVKLH